MYTDSNNKNAVNVCVRRPPWPYSAQKPQTGRKCKCSKPTTTKYKLYGKCGGSNESTLTIPKKSKGGWEIGYPMLGKNYKFYLAFENSKCLDYITEKFFTALKAGMIPVVMGGLSKKDYEKIAPRHSYIHVDDFPSPEDLMKRLHEISKDPLLYNSYFWWRSYYNAIVLYNYPWSHSWRVPGCHLCEVLNSGHITRNKYDDFTSFWYQCKQ